jgi:hypothetical protein
MHESDYTTGNDHFIVLPGFEIFPLMFRDEETKPLIPTVIVGCTTPPKQNIVGSDIHCLDLAGFGIAMFRHGESEAGERVLWFTGTKCAMKKQS